MNKKSLSERDICTKFITPAVKHAGWDEMSQIREEVSFTKGRIIVRGKLVTRAKAKRADYVLYYKPNIPIALIERAARRRAREWRTIERGHWHQAGVVGRRMAAFLDHIQISNFRCLKWVDVPLRPLTVLIGPNDSGKSAFLGAIRYMLGGMSIGLSDHWQQDAGNQPLITPSVTAGRRLEELQPVGFYQLPSQGVQMEGPGVEDSAAPRIEEGGDGVPALLDYLLRRDRQRFFAVVEAMRSLIPGLADLEIATPHPSVRRLLLVLENGLRLHANFSSTGVRILIVFVALAYHPSPPRTILLEEPENGVHPKRLADIMKLLREITEGKHGGQPAQVIVSTHSPYLVDLMDLDRDQLLVFQRNEDGSRTAVPADQARLKTFLEEFMLGEVWYNQGEEGLVANST